MLFLFLFAFADCLVQQGLILCVLYLLIANGVALSLLLVLSTTHFVFQLDNLHSFSSFCSFSSQLCMSCLLRRLLGLFSSNSCGILGRFAFLHLGSELTLDSIEFLFGKHSFSLQLFLQVFDVTLPSLVLSLLKAA